MATRCLGSASDGELLSQLLQHRRRLVQMVLDMSQDAAYNIPEFPLVDMHGTLSDLTDLEELETRTVIREDSQPRPAKRPKIVEHLPSSPADILAFCQNGLEILSNFIRPASDKETHVARSDSELVKLVIALRTVSRTKQRSLLWLPHLKTSHLLLALHEFARPGNLIESVHPSVENSFRDHAWRSLINLLLHNLLSFDPQYDPEPEYPPVQVPIVKFTPVDGFNMLRCLSDHPNALPWVSNPMAVFFLVSESNFQRDWTEWLGPTLTSLGFLIEPGWKVSDIYRTTTQIPQLRNLANLYKATFHPKLEQILRLDILYRLQKKGLNAQIFRTEQEGVVPCVGDDQIGNAAFEMSISLG
ncbi:hypothetical protein MIND_01145900 [Mycena indigotica]|uniref:Uncharacterized protein n=1 Tax=Mycena indigotica TaxID=2126181 RepID=A0A8H6S695_9AGAR|nr:uncharacterized protein MIND_01145900 [Mycena indigotica]KAF7293659.1 hypothetical protein MIND_01145900 [Mycena indigotica]